MTDEQKAAYVFAQSVCALCALEEVKAANRQRQSVGYADAYGDDVIANIPKEFCITHNAVIGLFHGE